MPIEPPVSCAVSFPLVPSKRLIDLGQARGNRTREWWLDAHRRYFARQARLEGFELDDQILTVFERFEVVWPLGVADKTT